MPKYSSLIILLIFNLLHFACESPPSGNLADLVEVPNQYAKGFGVFQGDGFKVIEVKQAFPGEHEPFRYLVLESTDLELDKTGFAAVVELPISKIVMTSTTHIPHLDYLGVSELLAGFPNLDLISSQGFNPC
jgi:iron complex transport system substrate-binding protein